MATETQRLVLTRELRRERWELEKSERAEVEGRVCDHEKWMRSLEQRRRRIAALQAELEELPA